jgi:hypothetical protein
MDIIRTNVQHIRSFNEDVREGYEYVSRAQLGLCVLLMSAAYLHTVVRRLSPGLKALVSIIPVVLVNIWLPMLFSSKTEIVTRMVRSNLRYQLSVLRQLTCVAELFSACVRPNDTKYMNNVQDPTCSELSCTLACGCCAGVHTRSILAGELQGGWISCGSCTVYVSALWPTFPAALGVLHLQGCWCGGCAGSCAGRSQLC